MFYLAWYAVRLMLRRTHPPGAGISFYATPLAALVGDMWIAYVCPLLPLGRGVAPHVAGFPPLRFSLRLVKERFPCGMLLR